MSTVLIQKPVQTNNDRECTSARVSMGRGVDDEQYEGMNSVVAFKPTLDGNGILNPRAFTGFAMGVRLGMCRADSV